VDLQEIRFGMDLFDLGQGPVADPSEHRNRP
jgi:hypothetical protein